MGIAVINIKDIIKYIVGFILVLAIFSVCISLIKKGELKNEIKSAENDAFSIMKNSSFLNCLKEEIPLIAIYDKKEEKKISKTSEIIINSQLALMHSLSEIEDIENKLVENNIESTEYNDTELNKEKNYSFDIPESANTEIIAENNINAKYTDSASTVQINNQTSYDLSSIIENPKYELNNKEKVIIYHTHTCESYTPSESFNYEMTGTYRTTDLNYTVSRVGDELEKYLTAFGKTVLHDKTYHDYPAYNGSYGRSLETMKAIIEKNNDAEIAIDLHRDAVRK